ncbi:hypothetical protein JG665_19070, partial [Vibrio cholerae]|uniref:hypothetical protein n=1 Tax=Vibrio cholerae TaxID=666 RepID=UPI0018F0D767
TAAKAGQKHNLRKVVASGNVRFSSPNEKATAEEAHYDAELDVLELMGPDIWLETKDGKSLTAHERIEYDRRNKRIEAKQGAV